MISRRQLRIKALQILYAYYKTGSSDVAKAEKELLFSINKAYDLYHYIFVLIIDIANLAESRIELSKKKLKPTAEDLNPNTRFINSNLLEQIRNTEQLNRYINAKKLNWANYPELIKDLLTSIQKNEDYIAFMNSEKVNFSDEKKLLISILTNVVYPNESLESVLEEQSIYWTDDLEYIISMVIKTLKIYRENGSAHDPLLDLFKNPDNSKIPEDKQFVIDLLRKTILNKDSYTEFIKSNTKNWDLDRIAFMDILIMQMAICEFINFPSIPTKVTLNEYLEISKLYSTNKSSVFINGVLDKVVMQLRKQNMINKTGRGLIGEKNESPEK
ncbi:MAG TPA: transcription antitermination factor NusB [Bacteroidales bacterium]|nr:transcription antitermination factor NusB [Bacteroidales bacterium]